MVGYALEKRINIILIDDGSGVNILPIRTMKELGITTEELSESRLMIQGFNQGGQRAIGAVKVDITIEDLQSSAWMHVIDAKTSYNMLLGRPWIHENKAVSKKIVADDKPFAIEESHFVDAKFYLKNYIVREVKVDDITTTNSEKVATKRADETIGKAGVDAEVPHPSPNKGNIVSLKKKKKTTPVLCYVPKLKKEEGQPSEAQGNVLGGLTLPIRRIDAINLSSKLFGDFAGYNPNEPSKLGKLPSGASMMQSREGLGYKQPPPVRISIKKECDEDEESVGSSYHITTPSDQDTSFQMEVAEKLENISSCYHISFNDGDPREDEDARDAPPELEEGVKITVDSLKEVNLGTDENPRPTYLSAFLTGDEEDTYMEILKEYRDVFAWSYKEMPGLDPKVAIHHPAVKNVKYPTWISSIVPVKKKIAKFEFVLTSWDLNNACPKDDFPLPIPELMIDATTGYEAMSFMDGSSGYNQIRMAPKDEELTAFRTPKGRSSTILLYFDTTLLHAEYQALILGLEMAVDMKQLQLQVFGDSQLVINQLLGSYEFRKPELLPRKNKKADALAALASALTQPDQTQVTIYQKWVVPPSNEDEGAESELEHLVAVSEAARKTGDNPSLTT
ncbi:uncharacterized protein LOC132038083 [Lycium ferocissimum]|uniref:uncharacterized protein LOC132038083 n=1 Tax=Lycium ferocissimum TaxID=112874 RepID=UPI0028155184|nr:uncharacterized protein LOC132038083 [Lycium ferocissimum]